MEIKNLDRTVLDATLKRSIVKSGYPMRLGEPDIDFEIENLGFWLDHGLKEIYDRIHYVPEKSKKTNVLYHRKTKNTIEIDNKTSRIHTRNNLGNITSEIIVDNEDLHKLLNYKWNLSSAGYAISNGVLMHRLITGSNNDVLVDHIDGNRLNNSKSNLRIATRQQNNRNKINQKNNSSGVIGVCWKADKQKWKAYITVDYKQIHIGYFYLKDKAIKARLETELELFKEFSPQLHLMEKYGIENPYKDSMPECEYDLKLALNSFSRVINLCKTNTASGHQTFLSGITVQFDIKYPQYFTPQLQRYHWIDIVSSQSKMHKLTKCTNIEEHCNEYVLPEIASWVDELIKQYNKDPNNENFMWVVSNLPMGYEMWMGISTNYLQLKTIYRQRRFHKLEDWQEFCNWIERLPLSYLITGKYD